MRNCRIHFKEEEKCPSSPCPRTSCLDWDHNLSLSLDSRLFRLHFASILLDHCQRPYWAGLHLCHMKYFIAKKWWCLGLISAELIILSLNEDDRGMSCCSEWRLISGDLTLSYFLFGWSFITQNVSRETIVTQFFVIIRSAASPSPFFLCGRECVSM